MKLMLLIMPTIQMHGRHDAPIERRESSSVPLGDERIVDAGDGDSQRHGDAGQHELAEELPAGPQLEPVVEEADADRQDRAAEQRQRSAAA